MSRALVLTLMALGLLALPVDPVSAQAAGRVAVEVVDENDEPLEGVAVTVTSDARSFEEIHTTNRRGRAVMTFGDATQTYRFNFEKEGHQSFELMIKPEVRGIAQRQIVLASLASAAPQVRDPETEGAATETGDPAVDAFNAGVLAFREGELEEAEARFRQAARLDPELAATHSALAGLLLERGELAEAAEAAGRLLELEPESSRAYQILHDAYEGLGDVARAAEALDALGRLEAGTDAAVRVFNQGADAARLGDTQRAREHFERAIELDPDLAPAHVALATVQLNQGDLADARQNAARALELDADNLIARKVRYDASRRLGETEAAESDLAALVEQDPQWITATYAEEGRALMDAGENEAARAAFEQVLEVDPDHPRAHYMLGLIHVQSDTARAKMHLERFVELAPDDSEAATAREMLQYLN